MQAKLIYRNKVVTENFITEFVIWEVVRTPDRPHGIKYRLYHSDKMGRCIVRYDNEAGKGDHKHLDKEELPYQFVSVEKLVEDFMLDIQQTQKEGNANDS